VAIYPHATVDCLPGVASYVGADISAGVLSSGLDDAEPVTLFLDVGTNGEIVWATANGWRPSRARRVRPSRERACCTGCAPRRRHRRDVDQRGILRHQLRVIGGTKPRGICGSGLISLVAEMFLTGVIDKSGNIDLDLPTARVRYGTHGPEYVVAWGDETHDGRDIVISRTDIDNLLRAKAAIYAGSPSWRTAWASRWKPSSRCISADRSASTSTSRRRSRSACCPTCPGPVSLPGQYLGSRRLSRPAQPRGPRAHCGYRLAHDLHRAIRRQYVFRRIYLGAVSAPHRPRALSDGAGSHTTIGRVTCISSAKIFILFPRK